MPFDLDRYHTLRTSRHVGVRLEYRESTTSTMDDARAGMAGRGSVYVGGEQTAGRGRLGRVWVSVPGAGLYATYHLCARDAQLAPLYSIAGGLAAADAIREAGRLATELKWPNDVLHGGLKLAGILAEGQHPPSADGRSEVFLGIGINVRDDALPPELAAAATSVEAAGGEVESLEALLAALSSALERHTLTIERQPAVLVEEWRARLVTLGRRVRLHSVDGRVHEGEAIDVTQRGELVLRTAAGITSHAAGDVTLQG